MVCMGRSRSTAAAKETSLSSWVFPQTLTRNFTNSLRFRFDIRTKTTRNSDICVREPTEVTIHRLLSNRYYLSFYIEYQNYIEASSRVYVVQTVQTNSRIFEMTPLIPITIVVSPRCCQIEFIFTEYIIISYVYYIRTILSIKIYLTYKFIPNKLRYGPLFHRHLKWMKQKNGKIEHLILFRWHGTQRPSQFRSLNITNLSIG